MNKQEQQYLDILYNLAIKGNMGGFHDARTKEKRVSMFGVQMRFDLNKGFPLLTTKKLHLKSIIHELLWFLSGDTNVKYLQDNGVKIWNEWATAEECAKFGRKEGDLGAIYGQQWRCFGATKNEDGSYAQDGFDQISYVVNEIKKNPYSTRLIVSAWHAKEAHEVSLPPCHSMFQFFVENGKLSCHLYQRSGDFFLGVPFNIASYSLLTMMIAQQCDLGLGEFVHTIGDCHLYDNHIDQAIEQYNRVPFEFPKMVINKADDIFSYTFEDFSLTNYQCHGSIKAPVAV